MKKYYFYILLFPSVIVSCLNNSDNFSEIGNENFSMMVPLNLIQPSDPQEGAVLHLCEDTSDSFKGLSVVVYKDSKIDQFDTTDIYSYYNFVSGDILDDTPETMNSGTPKDTIVNGLRCLLFKTCGLSNQPETDDMICYFTGVYEGKNDFYEVTVWCNEININRYSEDISKILGSFKEK